MASVKAFLLLGLLFIIVIFIYPELETAIDAVDVGASLKPVFSFIPIGLIGCMFATLIYLGVRD